MAVIVSMVKAKKVKRKENRTSIQISRELREELQKLGKMGDTYESIIKKLIQKYKSSD